MLVAVASSGNNTSFSNK